jgi:hypothetical protein
MRKSIALLVIAVLAIVATAQQKPASKPKPAAAAAASLDAGLPSEETVNAFMHATFGYDPQLTWKIQSIKPSAAEGLAEVDVLISGPQGRAARNST